MDKFSVAMISYLKIKSRHQFAMSDADLMVFSELLWLLKHSPPPIGFNRKPLSSKQQRIVDDIFDLISYPENYAESLNIKNGQ